MKYTIQAFKYILKNFLYIFPFAVLPAVFLSLSLDKRAMHEILTNYFAKNPSAPFSMIFHSVSIFNFRSWGAFFSGLAGIILMILCMALLFALIEKHMRIGKRTMSGLFSKLNDNLVSTAGICLLYVAIYEVWSLVTSALLFLTTLTGDTTGAKAATYVLSVVIFLGMHFVLLYLVSIFYLWLPCLQITGFRAFEALRYSYQLVASVKGKIVLGQWISVTVSEVLLALCVMFVPGRFASFALASVLYALMTLMFCVRMQVIYFDRAQLERADLKKYYHF